ncbi:DUF281 domain-containing protein [Caenorhabditis elegans]|uniref:DUF281 domain-containing protein n=1 Tax=Caenorhabditis elegans TaxID=6239 RepID=Q9XV19_CAEEL|nr:DUF281 domain-containing protein [Caenorhabditis elegans]CAB04400.1 DUF281 domain-containing protein [Caenorhabditis elegans]|eukprot:NP_507978.1 Uncharacterized protein CELE_F46B3.7 [Caenorhabditis elegans]
MLLLFVFYFVEAIVACIPTQETEPITPSCSACTPNYDTSCMGYNMPSAIDWCAIVTVPYTFTAGTPDTCTANLPCPAGTKPQFDTGYGFEDGANGAITCEETGPNMGIWSATVIAGARDFTNMRCQVI